MPASEKRNWISHLTNIRFGFQFWNTESRANFLVDSLRRSVIALGNMLAHTNFNGLVLTNLFDSMNRLLSKWSGSTSLETYSCDAMGQRANRVDTSGSYAWILDNRGRVTTNTTPVGALYFYDSLNRRTTTLFADGTTEVDPVV